MRIKNLEKAIILSMLAASVSVPVWAADTVTGPLWNEWWNQNKIVDAGNNLIVNGGTQVGIGYKGTVNVKDGNLTVNTASNGILAGYAKDATVNVLANNITINSGDNGIFTTWGDSFRDQLYGYSGNIIIGASDRKIDGLYINSGGQGIDNKQGSVTIYGTDDSIIDIHSKGISGKMSDQAGVYSNSSKGNVKIEGGTINISADHGSGIYNASKKDIIVTANNNIEITSDDKLTDKSKINNSGVYNSSGNTSITSNNGSITIESSKKGISNSSGTTTITSAAGNTIRAGKMDDFYYGDNLTVINNGAGVTDIKTTAGDNNISGAIQADNGKINISNKGSKQGEDNFIKSVTNINGTMSAVLSNGQNAQINISTGENGINYIATNADGKDEKENTIWAKEGTVNINGAVNISAGKAGQYIDGQKGNSLGIAVSAGGNTLGNDYQPIVNNNVVNIVYDNSAIEESIIVGDLVAGYGGKINVGKGFADIAQTYDEVNSVNNHLRLKGNALAGNGGELNVDLGNSGYWEGRADDYQDANIKNNNSFFNPAFSNRVEANGTVNIDLGEGSYWNVTGQSWVSSVTGNGTIDLRGDETGGHAIHIGKLTGENEFIVNLDKNGTGDMIYIKEGTSEKQTLKIDNKEEVLNSMEIGDEVRFATVGNSGGGFGDKTQIRDGGIRNVDFNIIYKDYNQDSNNNEDYNNAYNGGNSFNEEKPGSEYVENNYNLGEDSKNVYIVRRGGGDISDPGKTVVNMSKVNYSNAVYMDRLNKRLGEARYINPEEDQGMWVRMRHDRIGKDNEFRIKNTMYELGYDEKQECDNGEKRVGIAIDYMDGSSEYTGVGGTGEISRKGIWIYDTWMGDKGHYTDYVAKWGHLSNDFTLYRDNKKITGDYSNNVYSISAEYGRKKDIGNDWYFEPQVQLQYARVTDASYTTSQNTQVELDAINSLIARAGFRLGKDLDERSTVYFKADVLHEFLGDQGIYAKDGTGSMDVTYGNKGTWCDIGFGFATAMSKTSYAYLDLETSLGNDFDETYQINAGMQWTF